MEDLSTKKIGEIGQVLGDVIKGCNIKDVELRVKVDADKFKKIDEDLFYRLNVEGEFQPSDGHINVSFDNFNFVIFKEGGET